MILGPSEHLTWREMNCKDGTPYPLVWRDNRAIQLSQVFEMIRYVCNSPILVHSCYRTQFYNKKVGGARLSQHIQGRALDLAPPKNIPIDEFYDIIKRLSQISAIRGIGKYSKFVHVDIRPTVKLAEWTGV